MDRKAVPLVALCLMASGLFFLGCDTSRQDLQKSVEKMAGDMGRDLATVRNGVTTMARDIQEIYNNMAALDLSIDNLDISRGGSFKDFQDGKYYYKPERTGASYYLSPWNPKDQVVLRELKLMTYVEPALIKASRSADIYSMTFYGIHEPQSIGLLAPWIDMISNFPPGINIAVFEWYKRGLESSGEAIWSPGAFTDLRNGWVIDIAVPVFYQGKVKGVGVQSISVALLTQKYLSPSKENILFLGSDSTLLGQTPTAKALTNLEELEVVTLIKQVKENTFVPSRYKLTDSAQSPEVQALGKKILSGEKQFKQTFFGKNLFFTVSRIPDPELYLVGILEN